MNEFVCVERKEECMEAYRKQMLKITLYDGVICMIQDLKAKGIKVRIITDKFGVIQFGKPCDIAFRIMQNVGSLLFSNVMVFRIAILFAQPAKSEK